MKLVLDTNIYCDFAEGIPEVVDVIADLADQLCLPVIVIAELTYGFIKGNRQEANERKLREIINQLDIEILNINEDVARKYALIYNHLVGKGQKIPINDVWIAACCVGAGGTLFTRDKHFGNIALLDMFHLT